MIVHAKKQGAVITVFVDENMQPMPLSSFADTPAGFPYTANEAHIRSKWPGAQFVFHEEPREPQPEMKDVSDDLVNAMFRPSGPVNQTVQVAPPAKASSPPPRSDYPEDGFSQQAVLAAFEELVRSGASDEEIAGAGSLLLILDEEWGEDLKAAVARARAPKERKKFSL